jgi:hypothetical protein
MKLTDIYRALDTLPTWAGTSEHERLAFCDVAKDVDYGAEELRDAFEWFHLGFDAGAVADH